MNGEKIQPRNMSYNTRPGWKSLANKDTDFSVVLTLMRTS